LPQRQDPLTDLLQGGKWRARRAASGKKRLGPVTRAAVTAGNPVTDAGDVAGRGKSNAGQTALHRSTLDMIKSEKLGIFSLNTWVVHHFRHLVAQVNALEPAMQALTDKQLRRKTREFKKRLKQGETLDDIQAEAFAVVREAAMRTLCMRHFDVQIVGGAVLHAGAIAEMKTGEGKTLVSTLAAYLNALVGKGVHVVTVNDYLARRDAEWMGRVHSFLGLSVGVIQPGQNREERQLAYACDMTYGSNNEIGFDYLRDHLVQDPNERTLRWPDALHYSIVDEIDSVLIDEGRNPLLISNMSSSHVMRFPVAARVAEILRRDIDYTVDLKMRTVQLTDSGVAIVAESLRSEDAPGEGPGEGSVEGEGGDASDPDDIFETRNSFAQFVLTALKAKEFYLRDRDYIVRDGQVIIVDEFTGRTADMRRWSDGIHQAVEAKEGVEIKPVSETVAQVTYQSLFRLYGKVSGMTGTAKTEEEEFKRIFGMPVVVIPTNRPNIRKDLDVVVFLQALNKVHYVIQEILKMNQLGRPVLVGTSSVEESERLYAMLQVEHPRRFAHIQVLNARPENAAREAEIVAQAGRFGGITISTNMAGRGTDIVLGGNPELLSKEVLKWALFEAPAAAAGNYSAFKKGPHARQGFWPIELREETLRELYAAQFSWRSVAADWSEAQQQAVLEQAETQALRPSASPGAGEGKEEGLEWGERGEAGWGMGVGLAEGDDDMGMSPLPWRVGENTRENGSSFGSSNNGNSTSSSGSSGEGEGDESDEDDEEVWGGGGGVLGVRAVPRSMQEMVVRVVGRALGMVNADCKAHCREEGEYVRSLGGLHVIGTALSESRRIDNQAHCREEGEYVRSLGGLHVIGTALSESRRIDNQLRGRAGRQGDPGSTQFVISMEDDMMREVLPDSSRAMLEQLLYTGDFEEGFPHVALTLALVQTQKTIEAAMFERRRQMLDYDQVFELQRKQVYELRELILEESPADRHTRAQLYIQAVVDDIVKEYCSPSKPVESWPIDTMLKRLSRTTGIELSQHVNAASLSSALSHSPPSNAGHRWDLLNHLPNVLPPLPEVLPPLGGGSKAAGAAGAAGAGGAGGGAVETGDGGAHGTEGAARQELRWREILRDPSDLRGRSSKHLAAVRKYLGDVVVTCYKAHLALFAASPDQMEFCEREALLSTLDRLWSVHIANMARLRNAVSVQGFGRENPLEEFKIEGTRFFISTLFAIRRESVQALLAGFLADTEGEIDGGGGY
ncbi:hypothetical protein CLOM_g19008, partial [Closterium sp. NIES-68]